MADNWKALFSWHASILCSSELLTLERNLKPLGPEYMQHQSVVFPCSKVSSEPCLYGWWPGVPCVRRVWLLTMSCYSHKTSLPPPLAVVFRCEEGSWWFLIPRKAMPACMCALGPTWLERKTVIQLNWLCLVSNIVRPVTTTFNHKMWHFFPSECPGLCPLNLSASVSKIQLCS